jgi:hypothetical protein
MVNTVTQRTLVGSGSSKNIVRLISVISDGTEESNLVVYDNSAFVDNVLKGTLMEVWASGSDCVARLSWDQTTDSVAYSVNPALGKHLCFREFGGIGNPGATGATGDLLLNTANLDAGDEFTLIIWVTQN